MRRKATLTCLVALLSPALHAQDNMFDQYDDPRSERRERRAEQLRDREYEQGRSGEPMNLPPAQITSCDGGGCWDTNGVRYNRSGNMLFRQDGAACFTQGRQLRCQ